MSDNRRSKFSGWQGGARLRRVALVGGGPAGLGFLRILHGMNGVDLVAVPGHLSEQHTPLITPFAVRRGIRLAEKPPEDMDVIVSAGNHLIFGPELVKSKTIIINLHAAPLPEYAGSGAMAWAVLNGAKKFGVTFHYVSERIDEGEFFHYEPFLLDADMTAAQVEQRCVDTAIECFRVNAERFLSDRLPTTPIAKGSRPPYKRSELEPHRRVDLSWPPERVWRHVRAFDWDGILKPAYCEVGNHKISLTASERGKWIT